MSIHHAKPENALRRAIDFISVGKDQTALKTLHNIITAKRNRNYSEAHEEIMLKYIDLAVAQRENAKDALMQYRMICQNANPASLETVVKHFLSLSETRAREAQKKAAEAKEDFNVQDLEDSQTPESLYMSAMELGEAKERSDREIFAPWLKYLWDTYRTVLDVLRNNSKVDDVYQSVARQAFQFCKEFKRTSEFKRLCEILRNHLVAIQKYQSQPNAINLKAPEVIQSYLETRFEQLKVASELELWQEAFRTIDDIYSLIQLGKKEPKPSLMVLYYEKLAQIFWFSENYLFHAYALYKQYSLMLTSDVASSAADKQVMASRVLAAALSIPLPSRLSQGDEGTSLDRFSPEEERNQRLSTLLGFDSHPSRQNLLNELAAEGVIAQAAAEPRLVYELLEKRAEPLRLSQRILPCLTNFAVAESPLKQYVEILKQQAVIRVVQLLPNTFQSIRIPRFEKLLPGVTFPQVEQQLLLARRNEQIPRLRIDHRAQIIEFFASSDLDMPRMRNQLQELYKRLSNVADMLNPMTHEDRQTIRGQLFDIISGAVDTESREVALRRQIIEQRKQLHEKAAQEQQAHDAEEKAKARLRLEEQERMRLQQETQRRKELIAQREKEEADKKASQQLKEQLEQKMKEAEAKKSKVTTKKLEELISKAENLEDFDRQELLKAQNQIAAEEKKFKEKEHKDEFKKQDYLTRALRIEEKPFLAKALEDEKQSDLTHLQEQFSKHGQAHRQKWEVAITNKQRFMRMSTYQNIFHEKMMNKRQDQLDVLLQDYRKKVQAIDNKRAAEEAARQQKLREEQERREREEQERLAREQEERERQERLQREKEEAARRLQEKKAQLEREREEARRKEEELERKAQLAKEELLKSTAKPEAPSKPTGGAWRSSRVQQASTSEVGRPERTFERSERPERTMERSERPMERSERPMERSERPMERSERAMERSERPMERSERPMERSERPMERSERAVERPAAAAAAARPTEEQPWRRRTAPSDSAASQPAPSSSARSQPPPEQPKEDDGWTNVPAKSKRK